MLIQVHLSEKLDSYTRWIRERSTIELPVNYHRNQHWVVESDALKYLNLKTHERLVSFLLHNAVVHGFITAEGHINVHPVGLQLYVSNRMKTKLFLLSKGKLD
jgi:hypothetical protein